MAFPRVSAHGPDGIGRVEQPVNWPVLLGASVGDDAQLVERVTKAAVGIVWAATCRRYPGLIEVAARWVGPQRAVLRLDQAFSYPVLTVDAIKGIDPDEVAYEWDADTWRFDRPDRLVRQDPGAGDRWFPSQDPQRPISYPGSWWVELTIGIMPPPDVLAAAEFLAKELLLAHTDPERCSLPDRVQSISRQGVTLSFDRDMWVGVPLLKEIAQPYPIGHGCSAADFEFGRDPARDRWKPGRWAPNSCAVDERSWVPVDMETVPAIEAS